MTEFVAGKVLTEEDESRYIKAYIPLVNRVVKQLAYQVSSVIDRQDMEQLALMGLLTALRNYGHPDEQFASYAVHRIRGAILDELRQLDWRPRRLRQRSHKINDAIREISRKLGRAPELRDIQEFIAITAEEYQEYLLLECAKSLESLDALLNDEKGLDIPDRGTSTIEEKTIVSRTLKAALAALDKREQLILTLYYQHEMSLKEIALTLDLTEARICQMNKIITQKIGDFFNK